MKRSTRTRPELIEALVTTRSLFQATRAAGYQRRSHTGFITYLRSRGIRVVQRAPVLVIEVRP